MVEGAVYTHKGNIRKQNDDNYYLFQKTNSLDKEKQSYFAMGTCEGEALCAVFDGMGGKTYGNEASAYAAKLLCEKEVKLFQASISEKEGVLKNIILDINRKIFQYSIKKGDMGTTIALLYITDSKVYVLNVGDSPIYHVSGNKIEQVSKNHNLAQLLLDSNIISQDEYKLHEGKHQLLQYLGMDEEEMLIEPYLCSFLKEDFEDEEKFILCSDGLSDGMDKEELQEFLQLEESLEQITKKMVLGAMENGSRDNVTAMVLIIRR